MLMKRRERAVVIEHEHPLRSFGDVLEERGEVHAGGQCLQRGLHMFDGSISNLRTSSA
jgi:hypothetical protein